jgi:hypothetical protein
MITRIQLFFKKNMSIPEGFGQRYRVGSKAGDWKRHTEKIWADLDNLPYRVGASGYYEYWCEGHTHGVMPNFIIEVEEEQITLCDLGGEDDKIWPKLRELVDKWRELYDKGLFVTPI